MTVEELKQLRSEDPFLDGYYTLQGKLVDVYRNWKDYDKFNREYKQINKLLNKLLKETKDNGKNSK